MKQLLLSAALTALAASPALANKVFVSNERGNTVTVIDSETWEVLEEFDAGNRPRGITIAPDGSELYVCASDDDLVRVFDPETYEELHTLPSGPDPELFVIHPSGNPLYIANEDDNLVTVVDTETHEVLAEVPVGVEPEGMGISPNTQYVVNTSETTNMAHFINTETYEIEHNLLVDQRPRYAQYTADGTRLFVSSEIGGTVSVMDIAEDGTPTLVEKIEFEVPGVLPEWLQPVGVKVTEDGSRIFVALGPANRVAVIDGESLEVLDYIIVGQRVWQLAFTPDERYLISTNGNSNDITVIDVEAEEAIQTVQVGQQPWGVVVAPD
ncbi:40-residue YVTN family beta-propeller repeat-containing protein [Roseivivax marinus]|uniref:40-residue YVTN family beta-propeller repeat-containing protein n=1 Tax=Roseivivax marinus TaxID=1379903 RepID=W4HJC1_9RHOB|nr:YVTN family beta-propeller repeat protein [Roseivivax marinus]ETW12236.1 40-residue YVTN family beta-propeller repeat-containing protein [Roseivivax marinus]UMA64743.1 YVTN family beta-propeller repeat protein [Roseivivax marinus]